MHHGGPLCTTTVVCVCVLAEVCACMCEIIKIILYAFDDKSNQGQEQQSAGHGRCIKALGFLFVLQNIGWTACSLVARMMFFLGAGVLLY